MKKSTLELTAKICSLTLVLGLALACRPCRAAAVAVDTLEIGLSTEKAIVDEAPDDAWRTQESIKLGIHGELSDQVTGKIAVRLYNSRGYDPATTADFDASLETVIDEANVTLTAPLNLPVDVKIGRQYLNVGRGDGITTFNLFYPQSMRYATDLNEYRPVDAVRIDWYGDTLTVSGFVQTKFTPVYYGDTVQALMDRQSGKTASRLAQALSTTMQPMPSMPPIKLDFLPFQSETPDFGNGSAPGVGLKVSGSLGGYDVDLQYQHGYAALPTLKAAESALNITEEKVAVSPVLGYLPLDKIGVSWAGPLGGAGCWGELAYNRPAEDFYGEEVLSYAEYFPANLRPSEKGYITGLIGIDYFFANGVYANLQYVHGLPQEFTRPMINDYLTGDAYQTFKSDMLKVEGRVLYCLNDGSFAFMPAVTYKVNDNLTFLLKAVRFFGDEDEEEALAYLKPLSEVRLGVTLAL